MKVLIIEDRGLFGSRLTRRVCDALRSDGASATWRGHDSSRVPARWIPHDEAKTVDLDGYASLSMVLLDAWDLSAQQDDPTRTRLVSLDILERLRLLRPERRPKVVVYSSGMDLPEVNVPMRHLGLADAYFTLQSLEANLDSVLTSDFSAGVVAPCAADYQSLDVALADGADVAAAHQLMRSREDVWRQVWDPRPGFDRTASRWTSRKVLPVLGVPTSEGYDVAVSVVQRVAGLPYRAR